MTMYSNGIFEVIKSRTCEGVRYMVKRVGVKGIWFIYKDLKRAIDTADTLTNGIELEENK